MEEDRQLAYAHAQEALGRLDERMRLSPVRAAFRVRAHVAERQALAAIDAVPLHDHDIEIDGRGTVRTSTFDLSLGRRSIGTPISLDALAGDAMAVLDWLGMKPDPMGDGGVVNGPILDDMIARVETWQRAIERWRPSPPLIASAHVAASWRSHAPLGRSDLAASLLIGDRWGPGRWNGSHGGLIALGLDTQQSGWRMARDAALERLWLDAIRDAAQMLLDLELRLRGFAARARHFLDSRRRAGRLGDVLHLAMLRPYVTSAMVARHLQLTSAGAIKLLTIAAEAGLLIERTGQASYLHYAIPVAAPPGVPRDGRNPLDRSEPSIWQDDSVPWDWPG